MAAAERFVVLTQDLDFGIALILSEEPWPSVIQLRSADLAPEVIGPRVVSAVRGMVLELERGALLTIDPQRTRVRLLSIRRDP